MITFICIFIAVIAMLVAFGTNDDSGCWIAFIALVFAGMMVGIGFKATNHTTTQPIVKHLIQNDDGSYIRVETVDDKRVYVARTADKIYTFPFNEKKYGTVINWVKSDKQTIEQAKNVPTSLSKVFGFENQTIDVYTIYTDKIQL